MKYKVSVAIDGRISVTVEADSFEDAKNKAETEVCYIDWNQMESINTKVVNAEDEKGKFVDY